MRMPASSIDTGPEVISGSTRLKAGTAQKIVLNTLSSALMVRLHKVYGHLMVDLHATNAKADRASGPADHARHRPRRRRRARHAGAMPFQVKIAIVALLKELTVDKAQTLLDEADGDVRAALR